jgi:hypothetical protein
VGVTYLRADVLQMRPAIGWFLPKGDLHSDTGDKGAGDADCCAMAGPHGSSIANRSGQHRKMLRNRHFATLDWPM